MSEPEPPEREKGHRATAPEPDTGSGHDTRDDPDTAGDEHPVPGGLSAAASSGGSGEVLARALRSSRSAAESDRNARVSGRNTPARGSGARRALVGPQRVVRERVVLAERRGARMVRTRVEVAEQTEIGEALIGGLIRAQFGLAVRIGFVVVAVVAAIPALFAVEAVRGATLLGVSAPWLVLGVVPGPLLYAAGLAYVRLADRNEQDFAELAED